MVEKIKMKTDKEMSERAIKELKFIKEITLQLKKYKQKDFWAKSVFELLWKSYDETRELENHILRFQDNSKKYNDELISEYEKRLDELRNFKSKGTKK